MVYVLIALGVFGALYWFYGRKLSVWKDSSVRNLERQYARELGQTDTAAKSVIAEQEARLRRRFPGRSRQWYMEKMLYDLQRDRR